MDLIHFPIIYYFYSTNQESSLAHALPQLTRMAKAASEARDAERLRLDSAVLQAALDDLARVLASEFLNMDANAIRTPCFEPMRPIT